MTVELEGIGEDALRCSPVSISSFSPVRVEMKKKLD